MIYLCRKCRRFVLPGDFYKKVDGEAEHAACPPLTSPTGTPFKRLPAPGFFEITIGPMGKRYCLRADMVIGIMERGTDDMRAQEYQRTRLYLDNSRSEPDPIMGPDPEAPPGSDRKVVTGVAQTIACEPYDEVIRRVSEAMVTERLNRGTVVVADEKDLTPPEDGA